MKSLDQESIASLLTVAVPTGIVLPFIAYIVYIALLDAVVDAFEDFLIDLLEFVDSSFCVFYRNFLRLDVYE